MNRADTRKDTDTRQRATAIAVAALAVLFTTSCDTRTPPSPGMSGGEVSGGGSDLQAASSWGEVMRAVLADDARRAFVHPSGALVLNGDGLRAVAVDGDIAFVSPRVSIEELEARLGRAADDDGWGVRYKLSGLVEAETNRPAGPGSKSAAGSTVRIDHDLAGRRVTAEYENRPDGIEQRFVVSAGDAPDFVLRGELEGGLKPRLAADGSLAFVAGATDVLHVTAPRAWDANGVELAARFDVDEGRLDIHIQGATAYPVSIDPVWTSTGDGQPQAWFGASVASAGDVNNDGYDDVIVGAGNFDTANALAGKAYVFLGSATGPSVTPVWTSSGNDQGNARFGEAVASAGDINNDGYDDIIVGAYSFDLSFTDEGKVYLYLGTPTGPTPSEVWFSSGDNEAGASFGHSVAPAGDVNDDGFDDVIVGATGADDPPLTDVGKVFVYHGSATGMTLGWSALGTIPSNSFGISVAGAGDVNNDGYADVIIGSYNSTGMAWVYHGSISGLAATPAWNSNGDAQAFSFFGSSVAGAGDVNSDGFDDVIVGSYYYDSPLFNGGKAYAYYGSAAGISPVADWTSVGANQERAGFGYSVASAGDLNGDGFDDVIIGAPDPDGALPGSGSVFVFLGAASGIASSWAWFSIGDNQLISRYGASVDSGDFNGDGFSDIIVGASLFDAPGLNVGKAYVYLGADTVNGVCDPAGTPCDDGDMCTAFDSCDAAGFCVGGIPVFCNDGDVCTSDSCDPASGCQATPINCSDGDACNGIEGCDPATGCQPGTPLVCDDSDVCNGIETCDPALGCSPGSPLLCDDGDPCNGTETCDPGLGCMPGTPLACDDGSLCTSDTCVAGVGCQFSPLPNGTACGDGDVCNGDETCSGGLCAPGTPLTCNDGNACTNDSCAPATGCMFTNNTAACDDGSLCTSGDFCSGGTCGGTPVTCNDGDVCTNDSCSPATGCVFTNNTAACNDGDACTSGDACSAGSCSGTLVTCNDGNVCTDDSCSAATGCVFTNNTAACDDGDLCTSADVCNGAGACGGTPYSCVPGLCEVTSVCNGAGGCTITYDPAGTPCDDGTACSTGEMCTTVGTCVGTPLVCDDSDLCTDDSCDAVLGCQNVPNGCDITPPVVVHIHSVSDTEIIVWFDEDLDPVTADVAGNYLVDGAVFPATATLDAVDLTEVTLTGLTGLTPGAIASLVATGVEDLGGNPSASSATYYVDILPMSTPQMDDALGLPILDPSAFFTVQGWVPTTVFTPTSATIYELTGGLQIFDATAVAMFSEGDEVRVSGLINALNGEAGVGFGADSTRAYVLSSGNEMPVLCLDVPTFTADAESFEGYLVGFQGLSLAAGETWYFPGVNGGRLFEDGSGNQMLFRADLDSDVDDSPEPAWPTDIIGIAGQFDTSIPHDSGYRPIPRSIADFAGGICTCAPPNAATYWWYPGAGTCTVATCIPNFADCDGIAANGCEADLMNDLNTCGTCTIDCDDGSACTTGETCTAGGCVAGMAVDCDDGNACTDDSCDGVTGCANVNNSAACSDGNACTTGDACSGGTCTSGAPVSCDDGNACNGFETCNPATGCLTGTPLSCDDNDVCNGVETCNAATGCQAGTALACDDGDPCTTDSCDPVAGCQNIGACGTDSGLPGTDSGMPGTDAATPGPDSGIPGTDAATPGPDSGMPGTDAATPGTDSGDGDGRGGCGCRIVTDRSQETPLSLYLLLSVGLALFAVRRRSR